MTPELVEQVGLEAREVLGPTPAGPLTILCFTGGGFS
jgi:hypothetical protein